MSLPEPPDLWDLTRQYPIIVSDDDLSARNLMMLMLARQNLFSIANSQPEDTLYLCRHYPVSLVMSDLMKPGMSGFDMIEVMKKDPQTTHIPIIVCSARSDKTSVERALAVGADEFFSKPVGMSLEKLFNSIRRMLVEAHPRLSTTPFENTWQPDTTPSGFYPVHTSYRVQIPERSWLGTVHCL
jgi:CheY-like chemotaxis protein